MSIVTRLRAESVSSKWSLTEATELYDVARWGQGYFSINEQGHLQVHPTKEPARGVDLKRLIDRLQLRGLSAPILLRFTDILKHRLGEIHSAFQSAIAQHQYQGRYSCVYPIKVNQQRQVVEEVLNFGRQYGFGLEAGSKPELLAVVGAGRQRHARSSATASRTPSSSRWRCWRRRWAGSSSRSSRSTPSSS